MARAPGFPPMPSSWAQWWGYGYGPGHHAPIHTTPKRDAPDRGPRYIRTDACSLCYPEAYAPVGCYGDGRGCVGFGDSCYGPGGTSQLDPQASPFSANDSRPAAPSSPTAGRFDANSWR
jgi:hypothetical protein